MVLRQEWILDNQHVPVLCAVFGIRSRIYVNLHICIGENRKGRV